MAYDDEIKFNSSNANSSVSNSVSTTDDKAKAISFLPEILQNEKLKNFFDGTVEQAFSKANDTRVTEYIGRKSDVFYRPAKDNYKTETIKNRKTYQLETAGIIKDPDSKNLRDSVFYSEILNYIDSENGKTIDQNRLFEQKHYTFSAPIDYDKFINYENYYWYPSLDLNVPAIVIGGLVESFESVANSKTFVLTYSIAPNDIVEVNGVATADYESTGLNLSFATSSINVVTGDKITVNHRVDPNNIIGSKSYTSPNGVTLSSGMLIQFSDSSLVGTTYKDKKVFVESVGSKEGISLVETSDVETELFLKETFIPWDRADTIAQTDTTKGFDSERYDTIPDVATADYITINRGCKDKNPWSRTNGWVHKDNITNYRTYQEEVPEFHPFDSITDAIRGWDGGYFDSTTLLRETSFQLEQARKGQRPIIEFNKDIELYNYGSEHVTTVDVLESTATISDIEDQASYRVDDILLVEGYKVLFVNPNSQTDLVTWDANTDPWDYDKDGDGTPDTGWDVKSSTFDASSSIYEVKFVGGVIKLRALDDSTYYAGTELKIKDNDKVTIRLGGSNGGKEYYWTGYEWKLGQQKTGINKSPKFNLYDTNGIDLGNTSVYSSSTFTGNEIFGYTVGTGTNDTHLGFPLTYTDYTSLSTIQFKNYLNSETNGPAGFKYYKKYDYKNILQDTFEYKIIVQKASGTTGNKFYIDNIEQQNLILIRGNKYIFDIDDSSVTSRGYSDAYHPFLMSITENGSHASGVSYNTGIKYFHNDIEVTEAVYHSATFDNATVTKRKIEFTPTAGTPDQLYYYCKNHSGMGGSIRIVNNNVTNLTDGTVTTHNNEWAAVSTKSKQCLVQEFDVADEVSNELFLLESIIAGDDTVRVFINNKEKLQGTDYEIQKNQFIKLTTPAIDTDHILVKFKSFDTRDLYKAYYEVPKNLTNNALNSDVVTYDYGDLLNHFSGGVANQKGLTGLALGNNNYRDTEQDLTLSENILQHDAPFLKLASHVNSDDRDIIKSLRLAETDYVRFKYKFLNKILDVARRNDVTSWTDTKLVDTALAEINQNKKPNENWAYSLMLSYGDAKQTNTTTITTANKTWSSDTKNWAIQDYQNVLTDSSAGGLVTSYAYSPVNDKDSKSLYVYNNDKLLVMNQDYVITNATDNRIVFIGDNKPEVGDKVRVDFFDKKQPVFIPPTPSKLGIYQTFIPSEIVDKDSFNKGEQTFIQGHDGSLNLKFYDDRDRALLELEKRIFNDIENKFIDPDYTAPLSYESLVSNYFNTKDYSYLEFNQIFRAHIYRWMTFNDVNWQKNHPVLVSETDWRTWNWKSITNIKDTATPGHWRGIYKKFYGTDRPHLTPWEMLGFSIKPTWWDDTYSWTETDKRNKLISDVENGIIRYGRRENFKDLSYTKRANIYRRDGFSTYLPVDFQGDLQSPKDIGLCSREPNRVEAHFHWSIGDIAPAEKAFYMSSTMPFALMSALFVMKPTQFTELMFDTLNIDNSNINKLQKFDKNTGKRHTNNVYVHRETANTSIAVGTGYQQYISERLINQNKKPDILYGGVIRNITPQLAHKQGAFIDFGSYKCQAEAYSPTSKRTSIYIPDTNINHLLHISPSVQNATYSAIIIEKTARGWSVHGYDIGKNYFRTNVSLETGPSVPVQVGGKYLDIPYYQPNQSLVLGDYILYEGTYYKVKEAHTTGNSFDPTKFLSVAKPPMEGGASVTYYRASKENETVDVEYGKEFTTKQEVFDFIVNYGRYLESQGWIFDSINTDIQETYNWLYSAKEFLFWSLGNWPAESILAVSPAANKVKFKPLNGVVASVEDVIGSSYSILDKDGKPIDPSTTTIIRDGSTVKITSDEKRPIYFVNVYAREIEHITIFDNVTTFKDVIYDPALSIRQPRLKQTLLRTNDWNGKLEANGYLINTEKGIISNFETAASDVTTYLDIDKTTNNEQLNKAGLHTIGFQNRESLENLEIVDESQTRFYQGFVRQKGSRNSVDKILRTDIINERQEINLYEYYAFKVGEFGGTEINQSMEFRLDPTKIKTNPQVVKFLPRIDNVVTTDIITDDIITIDADDSLNWTKKPTGSKVSDVIWPTRAESFDLPTAGYVHINDTNFQALEKANLKTQYGNTVASNTDVAIGSTTWVAKDDNGDWNVYRLTDTNHGIESVITTNPLTVSMNETAGKLVTTANATFEAVLPDHKNADASTITTTTYGTKTFQLSLTDQVIEKTINFTDFGGANANVSVANVADGVSAMVVTTAGSGYSVGDTIEADGNGGTSASGTVATINGSGGITSITLTNPGGAYYGEPGNVSIKTGGSDSAGSSAVIRFKGNNPTYQINTTLSNASTPFQYGETITQANTGATGKVINVYTDGTSTILHIYDHTNTFDTTNQITGGTGGASTTGSHTVTARSGSAYGDSTFGAILNLTINKGGSNYVSPTMTISGTSPATGVVSASSGVINKAYVENGSYGYRKEFSDNPTIGIVVKDTITDSDNKYVDFTDQLIKPDSIANVQIVINTAFDGSNPQFDIGTTATPNSLLSNQSLSTNAVATSFGTPITDRANATLRIRFATTGSTTGTAKISVNYKKAIYNVFDLPENDVVAATTVSAYSSTFFNGSNKHPLYTYKDVRLATRNNGIDTSNIGADLAATVKDFVSNVCSTVTFTEGDKIWLDNGGDSYWYTMRMTANTTIKTRHDDIAFNKGVSSRGPVTSLTVDNVGVGYLLAPNVTITPRTGDDSGAGATATAKIDLVLTTNSAITVVTGETITQATTGASGTVVAGVTGATSVTLKDLNGTAFSLNKAHNYNLTGSTSGGLGTYLTNARGNLAAINGITLSAPGDNYQALPTITVTPHADDPNNPDGSSYLNPADRHSGLISITAAVISSTGDEIGSVKIGSNYWLVHSDVDYDQPDASIRQSIFDSSARTNKKNSQVNTKLFSQSKLTLIDTNDYTSEVPFEVIDPVKNLIPGNAQREINYITQSDPAVYTNHSSTNRVSINSPWDADHNGLTWWDTSTLRYLEYENFSDEYRQNNWGKLFPGSTVDIYEWTESSELPANYTGDGTVANTTNYCTITKTSKDGFTSTKYYFWTKNKTKVADSKYRSLSTTQISRLIKNPTSYGVNWYAPISTTALTISNATKHITSDSVFRLNYKKIDKDVPIHKQWIMIKENDPDTVVDKMIWNKLTDSLSGKDASGKAVPDTSILSKYSQYGNSVRPRQTWFKNIKEARRVFAYTLNNILKVTNLDVDYPEWENTLTDKTLYDKSDYYVNGYDDSIIVNKTVDYKANIDLSTLSDYDVIKVNYDYNSKSAIYVYGDRDVVLNGQAPVATANLDFTAGMATTSTGSYNETSNSNIASTTTTVSTFTGKADNPELVRISSKTSTTQLNNKFWTTTDDISTGVREWMNLLYTYLFLGSQKTYLNNLLFASVNFVFEEQNNIDWIIKTTYFDAVQKDLSLQQSVSYAPDTFSYVKDYINEAKPYHSKLINYTSKKQTPLENANVNVAETRTSKETLVFDRISKQIELVTENHPDGLTYSSWDENSGSYTTKTVQVFSDDKTQLVELKKKKTSTEIQSTGGAGDLTYGSTNSAIERIAKYHFANELAALDINSTDQITEFMRKLRVKLSPFRDIDFNSMISDGFATATDFNLTSYADDEAIESLGFDISDFDTSLKWDEDAVQDFFNTLFQTSLLWQPTTSYSTKITIDDNDQITTNNFVKYDDISHFPAWSSVSEYKVKDVVEYQGKIYRCNVQHKNLAGESGMQFSRWDLIDEYIYFAASDHTSTANFATDYAAGKWNLVVTKFDGAGFLRPLQEDRPEENFLMQMKETLKITVITYQETAADKKDLDSDGDTTETMGYGDQYAFRIFYGNDNKAQFKRLPKVCETSLSANIDLTVNQITVANASVLFDSVSVPDPDTNYDSSGNPTTAAIGTIPAIITGSVSSTNPGYVWIGDELIEFSEVSGNTLKKIRRGILGTPITNHTTDEVIYSSSSQHDIPNADTSARWSGFDPAGTKLVDKTIQANWDAVMFDSVEWDKAELDPSEQAIFIRQGGLSNFKLHNTTYVQPGYTTPSGDKTGYFNEE
tara:strand:+ start:1399 stop:13584 length:12186 start_codon:yes stop_codon:yes gene_type:complete